MHLSDSWKELTVHLDTYVDDAFDDYDIVVTVPEGAELSEVQRRTIVRIAENLDNEVCFALIDDRTCVTLSADDGRYGFEYFVSCVKDQIGSYEYCHPDFRVRYIGRGEYLLVVYDGLIRLIVPGDCPEMPVAMRGRGIPIDVQLLQRDKAREACAECLEPLAMVMPRDPIFHEDYDEDKAAWTEEDDDDEYDEYFEYDEDAEQQSVSATETFKRILHGELVVVTERRIEEFWDDRLDLLDEMYADLAELDAIRDDEIDELTSGLDAAAGVSGASLEARIAAIDEKCAHAKEIRELAFDTCDHFWLGDTLKNDELVEEIRRHYHAYFTLETGPKAVRLLLEGEGFDPERDVEETGAMLDALRSDPASGQEGSGSQRELAKLERLHGLLSELLEMEAAERRAAQEQAERLRMRLRAGNTLLVIGGPFEGRSVLVKEVGPHGRSAIVELEMMGRKVSVKIAEGDLRHS